MIRALDKTFPIVCVQSVGRSTKEEVAEAGRVYVQAYARRRRVICIADARLANHDAAQRKLWSDLVVTTSPHEGGMCAASIVMLDSPLLRGALTALDWLVPPKIPQFVAAHAAGAVETAREVARKDGIIVPEVIWGQVRLWLEDGYERERKRA